MLKEMDLQGVLSNGQLSSEFRKKIYERVEL